MSTKQRQNRQSGRDADRKPEAKRLDRGVDWKLFLWNSETKEFLGRNGDSWLKIAVFYLIYYAFLAAFFAFCMIVFYHTLDENRPTYTSKGMGSVMNTPGLSMRPDLYHTISYNPNKNETYAKQTASINKLFQHYQNRSNDLIRSNLPGDDSAMDWGYKTTSPSVLMKLNKIFDWVPKVYERNSDKLPKGLLDFIKNSTELNNSTEQMIWLWCETKVTDVTFTYSPRPGFPTKDVFPFINQEGFLMYLISITVNNLPIEKEVRVVCKTYAENLDASLVFTVVAEEEPKTE